MSSRWILGLLAIAFVSLVKAQSRLPYSTASENELRVFTPAGTSIFAPLRYRTDKCDPSASYTLTIYKNDEMLARTPAYLLREDDCLFAPGRASMSRAEKRKVRNEFMLALPRDAELFWRLETESNEVIDGRRFKIALAWSDVFNKKGLEKYWTTGGWYVSNGALMHGETSNGPSSLIPKLRASDLPRHPEEVGRFAVATANYTFERSCLSDCELGFLIDHSGGRSPSILTELFVNSINEWRIRKIQNDVEYITLVKLPSRVPSRLTISLDASFMRIEFDGETAYCRGHGLVGVNGGINEFGLRWETSANYGQEGQSDWVSINSIEVRETGRGGRSLCDLYGPIRP